MSQTFYVLMAQGWDYNDEFYFQVDGGHPEKVFTDKEKAKAEAAKLDLESFKELVISGELREYSAGGMDEILSNTVTEEDLLFEEGIFMTFFGKTAEEWWDSYYGRSWEDRHKNNVKGNPTEEQWMKLMSCFCLRFFDVVEVETG